MNELVEHLKRYRDLSSPRVESVMKSVDRARYCPSNFDRYRAYEDSPQGIGCGQTISAPHMHAMTLELLEAHLTRPGSCSLDVGSGSGWMVTAMAELAGTSGKVIGIDRIPELVEWGRANIERDRPHLLTSGRASIIVGDGWEGIPGQSFDAIHVGAAAERVPRALEQQLKPGGRMVIPVGGQHETQQLLVIDKLQDETFQSRVVTAVRYVPLVKP